ncbi:MAG: hypothetical protein PUB87_09560 [Eubacteriaceae bacterium]|nr:hypothetical protein [Eubacteriaceae bacterium]
MYCNSENGCGNVSRVTDSDTMAGNMTTAMDTEMAVMNSMNRMTPRSPYVLDYSQMTEYIASQPDNQLPATLPSTGSAGSSSGGSSVIPETIIPNAPTFRVPSNPLLPPEYQEVLSYDNLQYLNGFLRTQIGKYMRVEQLVGSNTIEERYGYLVGVGANYIILQELSTNNVMALDYYNIKLVYIYLTNPDLPTNATR